jgi:hypothetical protein
MAGWMDGWKEKERKTTKLSIRHADLRILLYSTLNTFCECGMDGISAMQHIEDCSMLGTSPKSYTQTQNESTAEIATNQSCSIMIIMKKILEQHSSNFETKMRAIHALDVSKLSIKQEPTMSTTTTTIIISKLDQGWNRTGFWEKPLYYPTAIGWLKTPKPIRNPVSIRNLILSLSGLHALSFSSYYSATPSSSRLIEPHWIVC